MSFPDRPNCQVSRYPWQLSGEVYKPRMFKYPSPWQVLCSSLERREQVSVNGEKESQPESEISTDFRNEYDTTDFTQTIVKVSTHHDVDSGDLQKSTKDFQNPLKLTEIVFDAQTESGLDVHTKDIHTDENINYICEEQRTHTIDIEVNTANSDLTMDRVTRSPIFSLPTSRSIEGSREDLSNFISEENQIADKRKDVWIPPPNRKSKLKVLREEERFEIRSHCAEISPSKLFVDSDDEDDGNYRRDSRKFTPEKAWELEQERKDIIKKQSQRKSLDADLNNLKDSAESPCINKEVNGGQTTADVDMEQINFAAARQQFIMLEKKRNRLPITPRLQHRPPRLSSLSLFENYSHPDISKKKEPFILGQSDSTVTQETTVRERSASLLRNQFLRNLSLDFVDTGKPELSNIGREETSQMESEEKDNIPNPSDETPIEREIRLALQREESLRKERGIQHSVESNEIVEIQKKTVPSISSENQLSIKTKDRARTAFFLQREIEREAQREADLKNEGKVAGLYDKGNSQEIDERKKLFEQLDELPVKPHQKLTSKGIITDTQDGKNQRESEEDYKSTTLTVVDTPLPYSVRTNWKPAPLNPYRTRRLSFDNILDISTPNETTSSQEASQETFVPKENFQVQPLKFGLHVQEDQAEDKKDYKLEKTPVSANGVEIYNARLRPAHSSVIEEEIRKILERDQELQEQRRKSGLPPVTPSKEDHYEYNQYGKPSLLSDGTTTWSSASRKIPPSSILPIKMFTPTTYPKIVFNDSEPSSLKRHDNSYAGIDPSDSVNTEIVESTRVNRHKSRMALRWEAGLYANEPSE